jgi:CHAT domain-containing protein
VDEHCVYAALVSKQGSIHVVEPVTISSQELRDAAKDVNPERWGQPLSWDPGKVSQDVSTRLAPLVSWLDAFLEQGIVQKGDHICYSPDDDLYNIPLQYLRFREGILMDWLSVSRVHSAFHLDLVLNSEACAAPGEYIGFVVPLRQDLEKKSGEELLTNLDAPLRWIKHHEQGGKAVRLTEATLECLQGEGLDHKIVHFSTHGWFPELGNPFHESYLLLAGKDGLPDRERVVHEDRQGRLTPSAILDTKLNFKGSHVSMMACVSGLGREGIAGDALGLDWALIQAGASSLISTHWKVSAASAARFFILFYQNWIENSQSRAAAFRNTMLQLLNGDHAPKALQQWAAFSLTGEIR